MEMINYTHAMLWYASWPVAIYISYKFIIFNIQHLEENLENKNTQESDQ